MGSKPWKTDLQKLLTHTAGMQPAVVIESSLGCRRGSGHVGWKRQDLVGNNMHHLFATVRFRD